MESKKKKNGTEEVKAIIEMMTEAKVRRIKFDAFGVSEIELTDLAFWEQAPIEKKQETEEKFEMNREEKIAKAKQYFNQMIGGI
jgi:hypothetical protein